MDEALGEIQFPPVIAPTDALALQDRQGRLLQEFSFGKSDEVEPFRRELPERVDIRGRRECTDTVEDRTVPLPLLRFGTGLHGRVADLGEDAMGTQGPSIGRGRHLHTAQDGTDP